MSHRGHADNQHGGRLATEDRTVIPVVGRVPHDGRRKSGDFLFPIPAGHSMGKNWMRAALVVVPPVMLGAGGAAEVGWSLLSTRGRMRACTERFFPVVDSRELSEGDSCHLYT